MENFVALVVTLIVGTVIVIAVHFASEASCNKQAEMMKVQHNYSTIGGCMINVKDRWIPLSSYKVIE